MHLRYWSNVLLIIIHRQEKSINLPNKTTKYFVTLQLELISNEWSKLSNNETDKADSSMSSDTKSTSAAINLTKSYIANKLPPIPSEMSKSENKSSQQKKVSMSFDIEKFIAANEKVNYLR